MRAIAIVLAAAVCAGVSAAPRSTVAARTIDTHVLWRDRGPIEKLDLFWGPGNAERAPKPPFTFVEEDRTGTKPKIEVTDAAGVKWTIKLAPVEPKGNEVHAEIAASRLAWALGYFVDEHYYVPEGRIAGATELRRAQTVVGEGGAFKVARFERKPDGAEPVGEWNIEDNRFKGTRELSGAQMLMVLLSSWDMPSHNTSTIRVPVPGGEPEIRYVLSDLGSTFGRMRGGYGASPSRWNLQEYGDEKIVAGIVQGRLEFKSTLGGPGHVAVPLEHARWFAALLSRLSDDQIRQAFKAAGASEDEIEGFTRHVRGRIVEIQSALKR
ncbi:MAG TPA: hypothetical protein VFV78_02230 [Vicinamibacterales bacterium]|nr:hypothetical protein [Vicinamibacterales bacterium]